MKHLYLFLALLFPALISTLPTYLGSLHNVIQERSPYIPPERGPSIPAAPADPPQPPGDGAGKWNSESPGITDYASKVKFGLIASAAGKLGLRNAERGLKHYLGNSGKDLDIKPESIMNDLDNFRSGVQALAQKEAKAAYTNASKAGDGAEAFVSKWTNYGYADGNLNKDWYYAIGSFSYAVSGLVTASKGQAELQYIVYIFDRYNWDNGKSVKIGPFTFEDKELGKLHRKGIAREYIVRGQSEIIKVEKYDANKTLPLPGAGGNRPKT